MQNEDNSQKSDHRSTDEHAVADPYSRTQEDILEPPSTVRETIRHLGPGIIIAGSIVGSGELIMTTILGAVAGFVFLWFVLLSCFVKVVVQAELARHTISSGQTFLQVFNALPGPSTLRPKWLTLSWLSVLMIACLVAVTAYVNLDSIKQTWIAGAGFGGGVIVVLCIAAWLIELRHQSSKVDSTANEEERPTVNWFTWLWLASMLLVFVNSGAILGGAGQTIQLALPEVFGEGGSRVWAIVIAIVSAGILLSGTYGSLEKTLIVLVSSFTVLTVLCTVLLQWTGDAVTWSDIGRGLSLGLPEEMTTSVTLTALAMYAGTGVAYAEMANYTYWCVEKGYARNTGEPQAGTAWPRRARGWIRVMYTDVLVTMVVYTASTVCFYLLGASILYSRQLYPDGLKTLSMLSSIYTESLGSWAATLFVVGAFFVLFSTVIASAAGLSRLLADLLGVVGIINPRDYSARLRFIRVFVVVALGLFAIAYWLFEDPPEMLRYTSSILAAVLYPTIGIGVLYLRHRRVDPRIVPGRATTAWLWVCAIALTVISPCGILLALAIKLGL